MNNIFDKNDYFFNYEPIETSSLFIENVKSIPENFTRIFGYLSISEDEGATSRICGNNNWISENSTAYITPKMEFIKLTLKTDDSQGQQIQSKTPPFDKNNPCKSAPSEHAE